MVSTATLSQYLENLDFPADREKLVRQAKSRNAPGDVIHLLNRLSDRQFNSMADVWQAVGQMA